MTRLKELVDDVLTYPNIPEGEPSQSELKRMLQALIAEAQRECLEKAVGVAEKTDTVEWQAGGEFGVYRSRTATNKDVANALRALLPSEVKPQCFRCRMVPDGHGDVELELCFCDECVKRRNSQGVKND